MNKLRQTEAILALHELGHPHSRIAQLLGIGASQVGYRIRKLQKQGDTTIETLQDAVEYWQGHALHYKAKYEALTHNQRPRHG